MMEMCCPGTRSIPGGTVAVPTGEGGGPAQCVSHSVVQLAQWSPRFCSGLGLTPQLFPARV